MSHWTPAEKAVIRTAPDWRSAVRHLPGRTPKAVQTQWLNVHGKVVAGPGSRPPQGARETKVAQILSAVKRIADRERIAVKAGDLIDALRDSDWERMDNIEWSAQQVVGRDVQ